MDSNSSAKKPSSDPETILQSYSIPTPHSRITETLAAIAATLAEFEGVPELEAIPDPEESAPRRPANLEECQRLAEQFLRTPGSRVRLRERAEGPGFLISVDNQGEAYRVEFESLIPQAFQRIEREILAPLRDALKGQFHLVRGVLTATGPQVLALEF